MYSGINNINVTLYDIKLGRVHFKGFNIDMIISGCQIQHTFISLVSEETTMHSISALKSMLGTFQIVKYSVIMRKCTFDGMYGNTRTALILEDSKVILTNCLLQNLRTPGTVSAIHASEGTSVVLKHCNIWMNLGSYGIFYIVSSSHLDISYSNVTSNVVMDSGGTITIQKESNLDMYHTNLTANVGLTGGAINCQNVTHMNIQLSYFEGNSASHFGGAIHMDSCNADITNTQFIHNIAWRDERIIPVERNQETFGLSIATEPATPIDEGIEVYDNNIPSGGAISMLEGSQLNLITCTFENNVARYGGCIVGINGSKISAQQSNFTGNNAFYTAVVISQNCTNIQFSNCNFMHNTANWGRTVVSLRSNSSALIDSCYFYNNSALVYNAGVIYATFRSSVQLWNSTFLHNSAGQGGGVIEINHATKLLIHYCDFRNSSSGSFGGVIYSNTKNMINITESLFEGNSAVLQGGVLCASLGSQVNIDNCTFQYNSLPNGLGGAVFGNTESRINILNSNLRNNHGGFRGGAVTAMAHSTVVMKNCDISNNIAGINGGGITSYKSNITIIDCSIHNNSAGRNGGAFMAWTDSHAIIRNTSFVGNLVKLGRGGAILCYTATTIEIYNVTFLWNSAHEYGGAIGIYGRSRIGITESTFQENHAGFMGGGIYSDTHSEVKVTFSEFTANSANALGGAVEVKRDSKCYFTRCSFHNNTSGIRGGTFHLVSGTIYIAKCDFINNKSLAEMPLGNDLYISDEEEEDGPQIVHTYQSTFTQNSQTFYSGDETFTKEAMKFNVIWMAPLNSIQETVYASGMFLPFIIIFSL